MKARFEVALWIKIIQILLPLAILCVVVVFELVTNGAWSKEFWVRSAFYGLLGPAATAITMGWIGIQLEKQTQTQKELEAATRSQMLTFYQVDHNLGAEANLEQLLQSMLQKILNWATLQGAAVMLLDDDQHYRLYANIGVQLDMVWFNQQPPLTQTAYLELNSRAQGCLAIPIQLADSKRLRQSDHPIGLLLLSDASEVLKRQEDFLVLCAQQVSLAVSNAQAYLRSEELSLTEERNRIAREIHDGMAQTLAFMALKLDLSDRLIDQNPTAAKSELEIVRTNLRQQIREVRRSIFALRPLDLERYGFLECVKRFSSAFAEQAGFKLELALPEKLELAQGSELVLFRVLQEALANAGKYAKASKIQVHLEAMSTKGAVLTIKDNGVGFAAHPQSEGMGGYGLVQMRERIEARGGTFVVHSAVGEGTSIEAKVLY